MRATFSVPLMCCTACAMKTKIALEAFGGVEKAHADFLKQEAWARFDPNMLDAERMRKAIDALGLKDTTVLRVEPWKPDPLPETG
jgi:copper chaperone CopZ